MGDRFQLARVLPVAVPAVTAAAVVTVAVATVAVTAVAGCASKEPSPDDQLQELVQLFPGHYDNVAQVQAEARQGTHAHEALALDIIPIDAPMVGQNVFYLQETAAEDARRVTAQRVIMFGVVKKEIVETVWTLAEPFRWRDGQRNPDLFKSLMTQDVRSNKGCSLRWKKVEGKFVGANEPKACHGATGTAAGVAQIQYRAELGPEEYSVAEVAVDKSGHVVGGNPAEPFYRFRKQSRE